MDISPRSSTATLSTTSSHPTPQSTIPTSHPEAHVKTSAELTSRHTFPSYLTYPSRQSENSDPAHSRRASIPYVELERQEREREQKEEKDREAKRQLDASHVNAHSHCGRHGDDWLFGGASVTDSVKWLFGKK